MSSTTPFIEGFNAPLSGALNPYSYNTIESGWWADGHAFRIRGLPAIAVKSGSAFQYDPLGNIVAKEVYETDPLFDNNGNNLSPH